MSINPEDRPSANQAVARLKLIAQEAAEEELVKDFAGPFERLFQVDTDDECTEEDLWGEEDSVEEEECFDNIVRNTMKRSVGK